MATFFRLTWILPFALIGLAILAGLLRNRLTGETYWPEVMIFEVFAPWILMSIPFGFGLDIVRTVFGWLFGGGGGSGGSGAVNVTVNLGTTQLNKPEDS